MVRRTPLIRFVTVTIILFPSSISRFFFAYVVASDSVRIFRDASEKKGSGNNKSLCPAVHSAGFCFVGRSHDLPPTPMISTLVGLVHPRMSPLYSTFSRLFFLSR